MTTKAMNAPLQKGKSRLNRNNGWDYLMIGFLVLFALICVYPFWYVVIGSFSAAACICGRGNGRCKTIR